MLISTMWPTPPAAAAAVAGALLARRDDTTAGSLRALDQYRLGLPLGVDRVDDDVRPGHRCAQARTAAQVGACVTHPARSRHAAGRIRVPVPGQHAHIVAAPGELGHDSLAQASGPARDNGQHTPTSRRLRPGRPSCRPVEQGRSRPSRPPLASGFGFPLAFRGARGIRCRARTVSGVRGSPAASG